MDNSLSPIKKNNIATMLLVLIITCPLLAQTTLQQRLAHAYALEREGKPAEAIVELQSLLNEKSLDTPAAGKAWNILGLAYEIKGTMLNLNMPMRDRFAYLRACRTM